MSHFAKIDENNIVTDVIVWSDDLSYLPSDKYGGNWIQTSFNTYKGQHVLGGVPLRKNFAGIGYIYDSNLDAFYAPQPFPSWTLNEETCEWECLVPYPNNDLINYWDENNREWKVK